MRARRGIVVGWAVVGAYAALLGVASLSAVREEDIDRSGSRGAPASPSTPSESFIAAWERSRTATFITTGTYERHSEVTGASVASEDVVVQRPPRRLHRQLGGIEGRDDDRLLVCPAPPPGEDPAPCHLGDPGGGTYDESVAIEIAGLRSILLGPAPLYSVEEGEPGCFDLEQLRVDPRAPFGVEASFCFDAGTGAPVRIRVRHEGGVEELLVVAQVTANVTDEDLEP